MRWWKGLPVRNNLLPAIALGFTALLVTGCGGTSQAEHTAQVSTGGNAERGLAALSRYGCGSCHIIPGVSGASGLAGPPLSGVGNRIYIAGVLQNTPQNMIRWIRDPHGVDEHTVMPNLGVTLQDATDIAGYLYTLK
jgi:cytochrome c